MVGDRRPAGIGPAPEAGLFLDTIAGPGVPLVLDAGFGDGRLRPQLTGSCRWVGIELDTGRAAAAAARGWFVLRADITSAVPLATGSVDGVVVSCVLNTVAARRRRATVVREIGRVLRPGGVVWVRDFVRAPENDHRIGAEVPVPYWEAMCRRYALGAELAAWFTGEPPSRLADGAFPAFDIAWPGDARLFGTHSYTAGQFRSAVAAARLSVPFVACHPTPDALRAEWEAVGEVIAARPDTARTRGGGIHPVDDIIVRKLRDSA